MCFFVAESYADRPFAICSSLRAAEDAEKKKSKCFVSAHIADDGCALKYIEIIVSQNNAWTVVSPSTSAFTKAAHYVGDWLS